MFADNLDFKFSEPKPECVVNDDCSNDKACINHACVNPCRESNACAQNAECRVQQHRPYCFCKHGMTGNAQSFCYERKSLHLTHQLVLFSKSNPVLTQSFVIVGCRADTDCLPVQACVNKECIDPCTYTQCGANAVCRVENGHNARCYCPESYYGNPLVSCERPQCVSNSECSTQLACINQKCQSPCACAPNAMCNVISHVPSCRCPPGYNGNPHENCLIGTNFISFFGHHAMLVCDSHIQILMGAYANFGKACCGCANLLT